MSYSHFSLSGIGWISWTVLQRIEKLGSPLIWVIESPTAIDSADISAIESSVLFAHLTDGNCVEIAKTFELLDFRSVAGGTKLSLRQTLEPDSWRTPKNRFLELTESKLDWLATDWPVGSSEAARSLLTRIPAKEKSLIQYGFDDTHLLACLLRSVQVTHGEWISMVGLSSSWELVVMPEEVRPRSKWAPDGVKVNRVSDSRSFPITPFSETTGRLFEIESLHEAIDLDALLHEFEVPSIPFETDHESAAKYAIARIDVFSCFGKPHRVVWQFAEHRPQNTWPNRTKMPAILTGVVQGYSPGNYLIECKLKGFSGSVPKIRVSTPDSGEGSSKGVHFPPSVGNRIQFYFDWDDIEYPVMLHTLRTSATPVEHTISINGQSKMVVSVGRRKSTLDSRGQSLE